MVKKTLRFNLFFLFLFLFLSSSIYALSAHEVEIITDKDYSPRVHQILKEAKESIQIIMFEAAYYEKYPDSPSNILIWDLIEAKKRGVRVEVILEIGTWKEVDKKNINVAKILSNNGINVRYDPPSITTHAKLIIIDKKISILGSNNWTYYSLHKNNEVSVIITSEKVAFELEKYFKRLWENSYGW